MPRSFRVLIPLLALCALAAVAAATAGAGYKPGEGPRACQGDAFDDRVGTQDDDVLDSGTRAARVYGLGGSDRLVGGSLRAACLFGGRDSDLVRIGSAGGIAFGEDGADILVGSEKIDALTGGTGPDFLDGGAGRDVMRGDGGTDGFEGGPGDDAIVAYDRRAEVVSCGSGSDTVAADPSDALIGCERERRLGQTRALPQRRPSPRRGRTRSIFRLRFKVPAAGRAGAYVVLGARCDKSPATPLTVFPAPGERVRRGQRVKVGLRPPEGGWCKGVREAVIGRRPPCAEGRECLAGMPLEPLAFVRFRVR